MLTTHMDKKWRENDKAWLEKTNVWLWRIQFTYCNGRGYIIVTRKLSVAGLWDTHRTLTKLLALEL